MSSTIRVWLIEVRVVQGRVVLAGILGVFTCIQGSRIGKCGIGHHWRLVVLLIHSLAPSPC